MPRKGPAPKRPVIIDPVYGSPLVSQLVSKILLDGKKTVAEFVDDPRKLALLQQIGVDYAQGWLFHPAVGVEEFVRLIWAEADEEPARMASAS